jgi:ATP-dependent DNA helicase RecG
MSRPMHKTLDTPVRYLKGIGPKRAKALEKSGIRIIEDLLYYFPRRYEDRTNFAAVSKLEEGQTYTIRVEILTIKERRSFRRRAFSILEMAVGDNTGKIFCVWFNQPYLKDYFKVGEAIILYGKVDRYGSRLQMSAPEFELVNVETDESLNIGRIVPVYTVPSGLTQRHLRQMIKEILDESLSQIKDSLPFDIRSRNNLLNLAKSLINIHFPESLQLQKQAYERLAFEEFLIFQLPLVLRKLRRKEKKGIAHDIEGELPEKFLASLSFKLTKSQENAIAEIKQDMASRQPMQRLLQGDVGSGKTVVATVACLIAVQGKCQAAFMAPTEILARQHYEKISSQVNKIRIVLLTSSTNKQEKQKIHKDIEDGKIDLVIGTHALLGGDVKFKNLGLVVIDEQHKFGVGQRALLPAKSINPDVLIMTATPIPRTLAITLYGDLDITVINEMPALRLPVKTLRFTNDEVKNSYKLARQEMEKGKQVYVVYPVIDDSYALDIAGAKKKYEELKKAEFKDFKVGLIHGRLKQKEQDEVMLKFKNKELDALVATTVLEVGIDVANATCMVIENAERFGLSQLHQLRGRVGRGFDASFCLLNSEAKTPDARARLEAMVKFGDGFKIAEEDLKIRGPGEFFGQRQHGLSELRIGNPLVQMQLLKRAKDEAIRLINLDPGLASRQNVFLKEKLLQRFPEYEELMVVG